MVFISKMVTSVSSPHEQKVRRQQGIARRRETSWRALAGLRNRHGQVSEPKSLGKEKVCPGTASKPRPTQVCGILSCRPLALPTFLWEAVLLLSKYRGLNTVSSFHPLSFSQAHMARRGPFFESGPSHPTKQKQVNWFGTHRRGCFLWLAFLRLLSFSSFRNGWVITPPFQVSSFVPGSKLKDQTWARHSPRFDISPLAMVLLGTMSKEMKEKKHFHSGLKLATFAGAQVAA